MKTVLRLLVFLLFLALPSAARGLWYYRGLYQPPALPAVEDFEIKLPVRQYQSQAPEPVASGGRVLLDLSHNNNLTVEDLNPLKDLLAARRAEVESLEGSDADLAASLRGATALVVLAPTIPFASYEQAAVEAFVADGGRLLLAADPTRPVPPGEEAEFLDLSALFFPDSAIPAANSLANRFGLVFSEDYLYNLEANEGNYRNVEYSDLDPDHALTTGLERLVFFAAHSLDGEGTPLVMGDGATRSNVRVGQPGLSPARIAQEGRVLAFGDVTFMTPPYHTVADNAHFLARIADWLAEDSRDWDLRDFPYLFTRPVDLVQIPEGDLDPRLVAVAGELQAALEPLNLDLDLVPSPDREHDVVYVGSFDQLAPVSGILAGQGVTITVGMEPDLEATPAADVGEEAEIEGQPEAAIPARELIEIEGLGQIGVSGSTLYVSDQTDGRLVLVVLAEDGQASIEGLQRLVRADFFGCVSDVGVTLCSTGQVQEGSGLDAVGTVSPEPAPSGLARVFILSDDDGPDGQQTGAADLAAILGEFYEVTVWSTTEDGLPSTEAVTGFDVYIMDSGDYAYDFDDFETFLAFTEVEGGVMFTGAQPLPLGDENLAPLFDLQVAEGTHPLLDGFDPAQVISLSESLSEVPSLVLTAEDFALGEEVGAQVIYNRGPVSPEAGSPVVVASEEGGERVIFAALAIYRLPPDTRSLFALNAVAWLLAE